MTEFASSLRGRRLAIAALLSSIGAASLLLLSARCWWLGDLAASFTWHVGWLTLAAAVLLAVLRARWLAVGAAVLALWHLAPEAQLCWPRASAPAKRTTLRVVAANVLQSNERLAEVAATLRALDADVVAVEELSLAMRDVLERELSAWPHRAFSPEPKSDWNRSTWALGVFSRLPLESSRRVQLGDSYAPAIEAVVAPDGRDVTLRVVHIPRPGRPWNMQRRAAALEDLLTRFEWSASCVALGDFNLTATSPGFAPLLARAHLRDSRAGFGRQPTWTLRQLVVPLAIAIDHVLVGDEIDVLARRTFEIPGSDHDGVVVELAHR